MAMALTSVQAATLQGKVESAGTGLPGYAVSLHASYVEHGPTWTLLGTGTSDSAGNFQLTYSIPPGLLSDRQPLLFIEAARGGVLLANAVGAASGAPAAVVINDRTTVALGNAFAQFIDGAQISGNLYGMANAAHMAANLADPETGAVGVVLASMPNGIETSTLATFNTLANAVAACVSDEAHCAQLFAAATPVGARHRPTCSRPLPTS